MGLEFGKRRAARIFLWRNVSLSMASASARAGCPISSGEGGACVGSKEEEESQCGAGDSNGVHRGLRTGPERRWNCGR